ncbi:Alpha/Beta hydrolase protein [Aspergillus pseudoustus]|uniref:Alpha/Beta hydrolase protein n=1 Tax=Aspergillus pseudoustus TaxID=1810923 RepID=A0ABR4L222_9EURO
MGDSGSQEEAKPQFKEEFIALSIPDTEYAAVLFGEGSPESGGFTTGTIDAIRDFHFNFEKQMYDNTPTLGTKESIGKIRMRDGFESEVRILRPSTLPEDGSPLVVLIFSGGFLVGTNMQNVPFARALSALYNATTISISYRLAPEYAFPTATNDVWDSLQWIAQHATLLGADPSKGFIIGGLSAGGNLTAVTAQRAVKEKLSPPLTGIWVSIPVVAAKADGIPEQYRDDWVSRTQNINSPILDPGDVENCRIAYKPDLASEDFSPFVHRDIASDIPPAFIQVAGLDCLRDDGLIYERYLRDNGVKTRLDVYPGVPHCHHAFHPDLALSKKFRADIPVGIGWLLGREVSEEEVKRVAGPVLGL